AAGARFRLRHAGTDPRLPRRGAGLDDARDDPATPELGAPVPARRGSSTLGEGDDGDGTLAQRGIAALLGGHREPGDEHTGEAHRAHHLHATGADDGAAPCARRTRISVRAPASRRTEVSAPTHSGPRGIVSTTSEALAPAMGRRPTIPSALSARRTASFRR